MKRLISHITLAVLAIFVLGSCSKNNGDIGYWFGLWHLDSIEVNGEVDNNYDGNYYDLTGRCMGTEVPTTPGIYIHNGNKICVSQMP